MFYVYKQSESVAARRYVYFHLVDSSDGITPETGEADGQPQISKNGAAFTNTTNVLVAIGNGSYYCELTASELSDFGFIMVRYKSANTAEYQILAQVIADDPYIVHGVGGIVPAGSGKGGKFTPAMAEDIASRVWKFMLGDRTAKDVLLSKSEFNASRDMVTVDHSTMMSHMETMAMGLKEIMEKDSGANMIMERLNQLTFPDYTPALEQMKNEMMQNFSSQLVAVGDLLKVKLPDLNDTLSKLNAVIPKIIDSNSDLEQMKQKLVDVQTYFEKLQNTVDEFGKQINLQLDIEKRFVALNNKVNDESIKNVVGQIQSMQEELRILIKNLLVTVTDVKYDIMKEIK